MTISNEIIEQDVSDALYWDNRVDASDIIVKADNAVVTLSGEVSSFFQKESAEEVALSIPVVTGVINEVSVKYPDEVPLDEDIEIFANKVMEWNQYLDASRIKISVKEGVLTLVGEVDTFWKRNRAAKQVSELEGVIGVKNKLAVVPLSDLEDQVIAEDIVSALDRSKIIDIEEIIVVVKEGMVTLSGTVPTWWAKYRASSIAEHILGVRGIENNLVVL